MSSMLLTLAEGAMEGALVVLATDPVRRPFGPKAVAGVVIGVLALIALVVFVCVRFSRVGPPCLLCGNLRTTPLGRLPLERQLEIMEYFRQYERRYPRTAAVFVCLECNSVHDDFSGLLRSREAGAYEVSVGNVTYCKVCGCPVRGCLPERGEVPCPKCGTKHRRRVDERSGMRFFMPPPDAEILEGFKDKGGAL